MDSWVIYNLEAGELRRVGACAMLEAAKMQVEHALPDGEWRHGYRHIWDYVVERSEHRRAVAFRIQLQVVPNAGPVGGLEP
jgi:hypothetical protein